MSRARVRHAAGRKPDGPVGFIRVLVAPPCLSDCGELLADAPSGGTPPDAMPAALRAAFQQVDEAVAAAKARLDPHERDPELQVALRAVDYYAGLKHRIVRGYRAQIVTNAWLKMHEITTQMGLVEASRVFVTPRRATLRAFCNAELPGAFVSALSQYVCAWFPDTQFDWVASSLYPSEGAGALGDLYGLYRENRSRWLMDAAMPGDVTDVRCIRELVRRAQDRLGAVDLYTSDVGTDVSEDYSRQEELTARLNLGQIVTGLLTLRPGGALVTKTYTFTQPYSLSVIGMCATVFHSFYVTKPETSRAANSEVYLVGLGFRGLAPEAADRLLAAVEDFDFGRPLFPLGLPAAENTLSTLLAAARRIHAERQNAALRRVMDLFEEYRGHMGALRAALDAESRAAQNCWLDDNPVGELKAGCRLYGNDNPAPPDAGPPESDRT